MAEEKHQAAQVSLLGRDRIQIEFLIDDLVKQLIHDRISPVANCNGCNSCGSAQVSLPNKERK